MLDLSWSHILIVLIVALVVVGPKDLPRLMRMTGRWVAKARSMADQFRKSFDEMARQSELDELRAELEALRHERPLADVETALHAPVLAGEAQSPPEESGVQAAKQEKVVAVKNAIGDGTDQ
jgi:sec-independent protein translocase protein TatB